MALGHPPLPLPLAAEDYVLEDLTVPVEGGEVKGGPPVPAPHVGVGPVPDHQLHHGQLPRHAGLLDGGLALLIVLVNVYVVTGCVQQVLQLPVVLVLQGVVKPGLEAGVVGDLVCGLWHRPGLSFGDL